MKNIDVSIVLLTYKGKILLTTKHVYTSNSQEETWSFISCLKEKKESFESAILHRIEHLTSLRLSRITYLSCFTEFRNRMYFYHANLTDKEVNNILRADGREIGFFTVKELKKTLISSRTKLFIERHSQILNGASILPLQQSV